MKTYLLCLRKSELKGLQAESVIFDAAAPFGLKKENCQSFCNVENFFKRLSEILESETLAILAVDTEVFLNIKSMLFSALSLSCITNDSISELLGPDTDKRKSHCMVPADATIFTTQDGFFSGFAVKYKKSNIIFLPLDDKKTPECINDSFENFLKTINKTSPSLDSNDTDLPTVMNLISKSIADACRILNDMGFKAAVSVSPAAEKLCKLLPSMEEVTFLPSSLERNSSSPKNYAALLAKEAATRSGVKIGASITNAYKVQNNEETKIFVCVAVSDSDAAKVKKIYAQPGESPLTLTACALDTVLDMIKGQAVRGKTILTEEDEEEINNFTPSVTKGTRKKLMVSTICAGAAALLLCLSIAIGAIINQTKVPVSSNSGNSSEENGISDNSSSDISKNFWDFLFSSPDDDEDSEDGNSADNQQDDNSEFGGNNSSHGSSQSGDTSATSGTETGTNPSEPGTGTTEKPTEQPSGERPTESNPAEPSTDEGTEPTQEPTQEQPSESEPNEPTEPPTDPVTPPAEPSTEAEENTTPVTENLLEVSAE